MRRDFNSMAEMLSFCEARRIVPVESYAARLLDMGADAAFRTSLPGVYDQDNGRCVVDFRRQKAYWKTKRGEMIPVDDMASFEGAQGDIMDYDGHVLVTAKSRRQCRFGPERPMFFKAMEAASAIVATVFREQHDHVVVMNPVPDNLEEVFYPDLMERSKNTRSAINNVTAAVVEDFGDLLDKYDWSDVWLTRTRGALVAEIKVDIRIRDYYERKFAAEFEREQEEQGF